MNLKEQRTEQKEGELTNERSVKLERKQMMGP